MTESEFEYIVLQATSALVERGYHFQKGPSHEMIECWKKPATGVYCLIRFEPLHYPDLDTFKVTLIRRRLEDFPEGEATYKPLILDFRNLMLGLYKKDIFPPKQFDWEFTDEVGLLEQIANAQALIIDYGIKWLEDPMSNIEWVGRREGQA